MDKVDHIPEAQAVDDIPNRAADDQTEAHLRQEVRTGQMIAIEIHRSQADDDRRDRKEMWKADIEHPKRNAGVVDQSQAQPIAKQR